MASLNKTQTNDKDAIPAYRLGVGVMIFNNRGLIFAGERQQMSNAWQMPQGGIDEGESPDAAMVRELYEETGIVQAHIKIIKQSDEWLAYDLPPSLRGQFWHGRYVGQKQKWYLCHFLGEDKDVNIMAHDPAEFVQWTWLSTDELLARAVDFKKDLYKQIFNLFMPEISKITD